jgi:hypothetical protein
VAGSAASRKPAAAAGGCSEPEVRQRLRRPAWGHAAANVAAPSRAPHPPPPGCAPAQACATTARQRMSPYRPCWYEPLSSSSRRATSRRARRSRPGAWKRYVRRKERRRRRQKAPAPGRSRRRRRPPAPPALQRRPPRTLAPAGAAARGPGRGARHYSGLRGTGRGGTEASVALSWQCLSPRCAPQGPPLVGSSPGGRHLRRACLRADPRVHACVP